VDGINHSAWLVGWVDISDNTMRLDVYSLAAVFVPLLLLVRKVNALPFVNLNFHHQTEIPKCGFNPAFMNLGGPVKPVVAQDDSGSSTDSDLSL